MGSIILSSERFKSTYLSIKDRYEKVLQNSQIPEKIEEKEEENQKNRFKKVQKILIRMKSSYSRPKIYAIKNLNALEKYQMMFKDEQRAVVVQMVELLEKVILHKKLNKEY